MDAIFKRYGAIASIYVVGLLVLPGRFMLYCLYERTNTGNRGVIVAGERVLVVDDGADMREFVVEAVLEPNGYQWLVAEDGQRGLELAIAESPDVILLDLQMPRLDGAGMLRAMKEHGLDIPVVLMTFHGSEEIAVEVFRMGAVDYVIKPFNIDELLVAMERALTGTRLRAERDQLTERLVASNLDLKHRIRELQTLYAVGKSLASLVDLNTLLARVADAAAFITNAEDTAIMLLDNASGELHNRIVKTGDNPAQAASGSAADQNTYASLQAAKPLLVDQEAAGNAGYNALYVPIILGKSPIGVLRVVSQMALGDHQTQLLGALADYVAIGLRPD
jgi:two-component system NtrC family sensor kinase